MLTLVNICCQNQNINSTQPQVNLNWRWVWYENDFAHHHHHPPQQTQCQQYLSCYWPDFDQTLKIGSWKHLEQIPAITVTFVKATFVLVTFVHIRNVWAITDPILTKLFWLKFVGALMFGTKIFEQKFFGTKILFYLNKFGPKFLWTNFFSTKNFFNYS